MSSIRCYDLDSHGHCLQHSGPFIRNGCSLMPKADGSERPLHDPVPDRTVVAMVCADCEIMASTFAQDAQLKCVCPGYAKTNEYSTINKIENDKENIDTSLAKIEILETNQAKRNNHEECNDSFQPNGMPNFKQCDPKWKCYPYAGHPELSSCTESVCTDEAMNNNICISGCGIVTSAMLLNFYGFKELIPTGILKLLNFMKISCT